MRAKFINESTYNIFKPKSEDEIFKNLKELSIEEKNKILINAAANGRKDIVELLVKAGADVNAKDKHERSALMISVWNDRKDIIKLLLNAGADVNVQDKNKWNVFMFTKHKDKDVVELLKRYGAKE